MLIIEIIFLIFFKDIWKFGINEIFNLFSPLFKKIFSIKQYYNERDKERYRFEFYANTMCQKCVK